MKSFNPAYDYMPTDVATQLPELYATEGIRDPLAHVKLFTPDGSWTWYVCEFDSDQRLCHGLVIGHEREIGYFTLDELESVRGHLGLPIERDLHWTPRPLSQCD